MICMCGASIELHEGRGRIRQYCSDRCRQRAKRDKDSHATTVTKINQVVTGDCRVLSRAIPDASIDLIFTDPPYPKQYLPLYGWLAQEASRVLKPGGFLLTYAGNMYKHEVMMSLGQHLTYFWDYIAMHAGMGTMVWPKNTVARHKSILAYVKGQGKPRCRTLGAWTGTGTDKRYHSWGKMRVPLATTSIASRSQVKRYSTRLWVEGRLLWYASNWGVILSGLRLT